jgi:penicillin-binding protein 1C
MTVKAVVGSANFFDPTIAGQVNGTLGKRSPGSTLKPFIYALAIDQGLIHEATMLKDAPTAFGSYSPENFDGQFEGPISARDALIRSRNVPAVALAAKLSRPNLYDLLKAAGVGPLATEQHYGLALALGGGELSMEELVQLYGMLGNYGVWRPLRYRSDTAPSPGVRLLSEDASFMVLDMLRHNPRPDGLADPPPPVAWKSGTSWGFRDAWSVGLVGPYVVAVWVGNFDGSSNPSLVGTQMAAPLLFHIVDGLRASVSSLPDLGARVPARVRRVEVCAASGDLPNADCPHTLQTWFIPGVSPIRVSTVHQRLVIDLRTGLQACSDTPEQFRSSQVFEVWPSDLRRLFAQAGMPRRQPPESRCAKSAASGGADPSIVSPRNGVSYALHARGLGSETIALNAIAAGEVGKLYWFVDEVFVGSGDPSTPVGWNPQRSGRFKVSVVDDRGGSATRATAVTLVP